MRMWHGTDAHNAGAIIEQGLLRDPEWRHYAEDGDSPELASLPGAYVTGNLAAAVGYAYKVALEGAGSLAIVEVAPSDLVPDEDIVSIALGKAIRARRDPVAIAEALHADLTMAVEAPPHHGLLIDLWRASGPFWDSEGGEGADAYRAAMEAVCAAYAPTAAAPHPVYLAGKHSARAPEGIPASRVLSVTVFNVAFEDGLATAADPMTLSGTRIPDPMLQDAVQRLDLDGFFGVDCDGFQPAVM